MEELRLVAGALLTGLGALGGGVGIGTLTSKYIEAVARQPELQGQLFAQVLIALGLTDALICMFSPVLLFISLMALFRETSPSIA